MWLGPFVSVYGLQRSCQGQRTLQVPLKVKRDPLGEVSGLSAMISDTIKKTLKLDQINCLLKVSVSRH